MNIKINNFQHITRLKLTSVFVINNACKIDLIVSKFLF